MDVTGGEHRDISLLMCLFFTILPITRSLDPLERTSLTPINLYRGARVPIQDVHVELYQGRKDVPNVEIWPVEDANFSTTSVSQQKPGVLENCVQGLPNGNRCFLTMLYPAVGPGRTSADAEKTMIKVFY